MIRNNSSIHISFIIVLISSLLFIPYLGQVHLFDWDEINFAESAREMIVTGDYLTVQIDFQPFWEKPPLFIWFQVVSMKLFGINEFAARFPNAICGIVTLLLLFNIGKRIVNKEFGILWVLAYIGSILPFFYFKSGIIDPWFNLFIFLGIYFLYNYFEFDLKRKYNIFLSAVFIGLSILTKGPVGLLIFGLTGFIYWLWKGFRIKIYIVDILLFIITFVIVGGFWFILQIFNGNYDILVDFFEYQVRLFKTKDAGHGGFLLYHFVIVFLGVFPASIFAIKAFKKDKFEKTIVQNFKLIMSILFWTVLIVFTIVRTKIVHYSSMCYFPLTFLAAYAIYKIIYLKEQFNRWMLVLLTLIGCIYAIAISALPIIDKNKEWVIEKFNIADQFTLANLRADASWSGYEFLIGLLLVVAILLMIFLRKSRRLQASIYSLFIGSILFIFLTVLFITPRIEQYSQRAAIEFLKDLRGKDCYVKSLGIKSYAIHFYTDKQPPENCELYKKDLLLVENIDKDIYVVIRSKKLKYYQEKYPDLELLYEKNGYSFLIRKKNLEHSFAN